MVVTMGAVSLMLISSAAALQSVSGDQAPGRKDRDRKAAYAAAEAGLQIYVHRLLNDNTYWAQCDAVADDGINQPWAKPDRAPGQPEPTDPRDWESLSDNSAQWTVEMVPVPGKPKCDKADPEGSMVAEGTPTFRVRVTGQSLLDGKPIGAKRSLIATFKRKSFLDYIYFTDLEVTDPSIYVGYLAKGDETRERAGENPSTTEPTKQRNIAEWGGVACSQYSYVKAVANKSDGAEYRMDQRFLGTAPSGGKRDVGTTSWTSWTTGCSEITFSTNDWIQGPMHTNDTSQICGSPRFGRKPTDVIEISGPGDTSIKDKTKSWRVSSQSGCSGSVPDVNFEGDPSPDSTLGTWKFNQKLLKMPSSNMSLKSEAPMNYTFKGRTLIRLANGSLNVTGENAAGQVLNNQTMAYPENGVIYVDNESCPATYDTMTADANKRDGCGIAVVKGTYDTSLTIAAADDILIDGNIIRKDGAPAVLGMVSNNFIRLHHPVTSQSNCAQGTSTSNASGSLTDPRIDAALLALKHSFVVDNWACGGTLGTLTVNGAIAQKYRGPVGTGSGKTMSTGYLKLYKYDDRLRVRVPPKFIDPVESAWGIQSYQEQAPAQ